MATRDDLVSWVEEAPRENEGEATVIDVARHIWENHEHELKLSGNLFFTWQYDMRWAALKLRKSGIISPADAIEKGRWRLAG